MIQIDNHDNCEYNEEILNIKNENCSLSDIDWEEVVEIVEKLN